MKKKILHIMNCDKFIPPYIEFIKENFKNDFSQHKFLITSGMAVEKLPKYSNVYVNLPSNKKRLQRYKSTFKHYLHVAIEMNKSDKIIIHNLFDNRIVLMLFFMPWTLRKSCWVMWGADLYTYKLDERDFRWKFNEFFRRPVIKNFAYFTTTVPGDFELVKSWYNSNSKFIQNLMYPSHLYRDLEDSKFIEKSELFIQVGNSAAPSNNHFEVLDFIYNSKIDNYKLFCPLSYGPVKHRDSVIHYGKRKLGNNFVPLIDYMDFSQYNKYMSSIDIAIFNHDRQQGLGNMIGLLSLGKKVILKSNTTPYAFFKSLDLDVYSLNDTNVLKTLSEHSRNKNIQIMRKNFSPEKLKSDWDKVFNAN